MKQLNFRWIFLSLACCALCSFAASGKKTDKFIPDQRFASIDTLAEFMITGLWEVNTPEKMLERLDQESLAIKSYWAWNKCPALVDLRTYADNLIGGSTFDMVLSSEIQAAISHNLMAKDYRERYQENPLYVDEMRDWLALENELNNYGGNVAYLSNWGGSLARLVAGGVIHTNATCRQENYSQLHGGGQFAECPTSLEEACASFRQAASMTLEPDEYMMEETGYNEMMTNLQQSGKLVRELFDKWLVSHLRLCESEGIPASHTAAFIQSLTENIPGSEGL